MSAGWPVEVKSVRGARPRRRSRGRHRPEWSATVVTRGPGRPALTMAGAGASWEGRCRPQSVIEDSESEMPRVTCQVGGVVGRYVVYCRAWWERKWFRLRSAAESQQRPAKVERMGKGPSGSMPVFPSRGERVRARGRMAVRLRIQRRWSISVKRSGHCIGGSVYDMLD